MISEFNQIEELFNEINKVMHRKVTVFIIGGAVMLYQGLKPATKDIDIVVNTSEEFTELQKALIKLQFTPKIPGTEYKHMNLNQVFQREDFRIDIFQKEVCGKFSLSLEMMQRAKTVIDFNHIKVVLSSNEDVFLFKTMTEREGDLEDCVSLAQTGIEWDIIFSELKIQMKESKQNIWITWVGERLDLLEERGLTIPIMTEINKLKEAFFGEWEKTQLQQK